MNRLKSFSFLSLLVLICFSSGAFAWRGGGGHGGGGYYHGGGYGYHGGPYYSTVFVGGVPYYFYDGVYYDYQGGYVVPAPVMVVPSPMVLPRTSQLNSQPHRCSVQRFRPLLLERRNPSATPLMLRYISRIPGENTIRSSWSSARTAIWADGRILSWSSDSSPAPGALWKLIILKRQFHFSFGLISLI